MRKILLAKGFSPLQNRENYGKLNVRRPRLVRSRGLFCKNHLDVLTGTGKEGFGKLEEKLKLYGFNNLTKSLSFNIYDICYAKSQREQEDYIKYIDEQYNSERLTKILSRVTEMIGARILNIAKQDYEPQGASVTLLIAEEAAVATGQKKPIVKKAKPLRDTIVAHLDKSHVTVHTYPEFHPETSIATFRVDIDVATCGEITPLKTLDYLIGQFDSDIITMDYRVRGFTRDVSGKKLFQDQKMTSIQEYIEEDTLNDYDAVDINLYQANLFHTRMLIKEPELQNYLFNTDIYEIPPKTRLAITSSLRREMIEIFSGRNVYWRRPGAPADTVSCGGRGSADGRTPGRPSRSRQASGARRRRFPRWRRTDPYARGFRGRRQAVQGRQVQLRGAASGDGQQRGGSRKFSGRRKAL